jgi:glycosyltransferase involved in cell wall biosynthesis
LKISIIVPAYNEAEIICQNLQKIDNSFNHINYDFEKEFIVCDNNSSDETAKLAKQFGAKTVFESFNQISQARNTGAKHASGDWLVFIDADSWPSISLIQKMFEIIFDTGYVGGSSKVKFNHAPIWWKTSWEISNISMKLLQLTPTGAFLFCEKNAFNSVGGFNTDLFILEDLDFVHKLRKFGRRNNKKFTILNEPIYSSARKAKIFGPKAFVKMAVALSKNGKSALKNKNNFPQWYDR